MVISAHMEKQNQGVKNVVVILIVLMIKLNLIVENVKEAVFVNTIKLKQDVKNVEGCRYVNQNGAILFQIKKKMVIVYYAL